MQLGLHIICLTLISISTFSSSSNANISTAEHTVDTPAITTTNNSYSETEVEIEFNEAKQKYLDIKHSLQSSNANDLINIIARFRDIQATCEDKINKEIKRIGIRKASNSRYWSILNEIKIKADIIAAWSYLYAGKISDEESKKDLINKALDIFKKYSDTANPTDQVILDIKCGEAICFFELGDYRSSLETIDIPEYSLFNLEDDAQKKVTQIKLENFYKLEYTVKLEENAELYFELRGIDTPIDSIEARMALLWIESLAKLSKKHLFNPHYTFFNNKLILISSSFYINQPSLRDPLVTKLEDIKAKTPCTILANMNNAISENDFQSAKDFYDTAGSIINADNEIKRELDYLNCISLYRLGDNSQCLTAVSDYTKNYQLQKTDKILVKAGIECGLEINNQTHDTSKRMSELLELAKTNDIEKEYIAFSEARSMANSNNYRGCIEKLESIENADNDNLYLAEKKYKLLSLAYDKIANLSTNLPAKEKARLKSLEYILATKELVSQTSPDSIDELNTFAVKILTESILDKTITTQTGQFYLDKLFSDTGDESKFIAAAINISSGNIESLHLSINDIKKADIDERLKAMCYSKAVNILTNKDNNSSTDLRVIAMIFEEMITLSDEIIDKDGILSIKRKLAGTYYDLEQYENALEIYENLSENNNFIFSLNEIRCYANTLQTSGAFEKAMKYWSIIMKQSKRYSNEWLESNFKILDCLNSSGKTEEGKRQQEYFLLRFGQKLPDEWRNKFANFNWR